MIRLRKFIFSIFLLSIMATGSLLLFAAITDAPVLHGDTDFNISYKAGKTLDIYHPINKVHSRAPVLVYFHGGAWIVGSKIMVNSARYNDAFKTLREKGYAIVSPKYTLSRKGSSPFPACLDDAGDVLKWIANHAEQYHFDLDRVGLMGESAGAHIALMTAYQEPPHSPEILIPYVIDIYGPTDLFKLYDEMSPMVNKIYNAAGKLPEPIQNRVDLPKIFFGFDPATDTLKAQQIAARFSPLHQLHDCIPNTLMIHGDQDRIVPISQSVYLKERLDELGIPNELHVPDGVGHAFKRASSAQREQVQDWIVGFVLAH